MLNDAVIYIHVDENKWTAFGADSFSERLLYKYMKLRKGIASSVEPGGYEFRLRREGFHIIEELTPTNW